MGLYCRESGMKSKAGKATAGTMTNTKLGGGALKTNKSTSQTRAGALSQIVRKWNEVTYEEESYYTSRVCDSEIELFFSTSKKTGALRSGKDHMYSRLVEDYIL